MLADGLGGAVRAEFVKMRSLPSAAITLLLVSVISLGISGLGGWSYRHAIATHSPSLVRASPPLGLVSTVFSTARSPRSSSPSCWSPASTDPE